MVRYVEKPNAQQHSKDFVNVFNKLMNVSVKFDCEQVLERSHAKLTLIADVKFPKRKKIIKVLIH